MTISNIEKKFDEKFEGIYYGKDINGLPNYPPESFKDDILKMILGSSTVSRLKN